VRRPLISIDPAAVIVGPSDRAGRRRPARNGRALRAPEPARNL